MNEIQFNNADVSSMAQAFRRKQERRDQQRRRRQRQQPTQPWLGGMNPVQTDDPPSSSSQHGVQQPSAPGALAKFGGTRDTPQPDGMDLDDFSHMVDESWISRASGDGMSAGFNVTTVFGEEHDPNGWFGASLWDRQTLPAGPSVGVGTSEGCSP